MDPLFVSQYSLRDVRGLKKLYFVKKLTSPNTCTLCMYSVVMLQEEFTFFLFYLFQFGLEVAGYS